MSSQRKVVAGNPNELAMRVAAFPAFRVAFFLLVLGSASIKQADDSWASTVSNQTRSISGCRRTGRRLEQIHDFDSRTLRETVQDEVDDLFPRRRTGHTVHTPSNRTTR